MRRSTPSLNRWCVLIAWPDTPDKAPCGLVFYFTDELPESEIRKRLIACGAQMRFIRVHEETCEVLPDGTRTETHTKIPRDLEAIERAMQREAEAAGLPPIMVVFDPIGAYLDTDLNDNAAKDMYDAMGELRAFTERNNIAVIICQHQTKKSDVSSVNKGLGSVAAAGRTRAQHMICDNPQSEDRNSKLFLPVKMTFGGTLNGYVWHIESDGAVRFDGPTELTADKARALLSGRLKSGKDSESQGDALHKQALAADGIMNAIERRGGHPVSSTMIKEELFRSEQRISARTVDEASKTLERNGLKEDCRMDKQPG